MWSCFQGVSLHFCGPETLRVVYTEQKESDGARGDRRTHCAWE